MSRFKELCQNGEEFRFFTKSSFWANDVEMLNTSKSEVIVPRDWEGRENILCITMGLKGAQHFLYITESLRGATFSGESLSDGTPFQGSSPKRSHSFSSVCLKARQKLVASFSSDGPGQL